jgi:hypothetical protein
MEYEKYEDVSKSFQAESNEIKNNKINTFWEATQRVMVANSLEWLTK